MAGTMEAQLLTRMLPRGSTGTQWRPAMIDLKNNYDAGGANSGRGRIRFITFEHYSTLDQDYITSSKTLVNTR
eukprot:6196065-Pleurochrysis_carterae.AAC.1